MTETATGGTAPAGLRITILGDGGKVDVVVPLYASVATVAAAYSEQTASDPVRLHTAAGAPLPPESTVIAARVAHGDVLVAVTGSGLRGRRVRGEEPAATPAPAPAGPSVLTRVAVLGPVVAVASTAVATAAMLVEGGAARELGALGLLLVALVVVVLARGDRRVDAAWLTVVPSMTAGAAAAAVFAGTQPLLLTFAVAALVAAATAAAVRTGAPRVADDAMLCWMVGGSGVAVLGAGCLLLDWPVAAFWSLLLVAAVLVMRLLPSVVVDVPDQVLLDFARLAVTAWTAREEPRTSFRGTVQHDDVASVAARASRLVTVASVFVAGATVVAVGALLLDDHSTAGEVGAILMALGTGGALTLGGRNLRVPVARRTQRTAGTLVLLASAVWLLGHASAGLLPLLIALTIGTGVLVAVVARAAGRGWSSVRWSRTAEWSETLAVVLVFATSALASGLFDWVRALTSS